MVVGEKNYFNNKPPSSLAWQSARVCKLYKTTPWPWSKCKAKSCITITLADGAFDQGSVIVDGDNETSKWFWYKPDRTYRRPSTQVVIIIEWELKVLILEQEGEKKSPVETFHPLIYKISFFKKVLLPEEKVSKSLKTLRTRFALIEMVVEESNVPFQKNTAPAPTEILCWKVPDTKMPISPVFASFAQGK